MTDEFSHLKGYGVEWFAEQTGMSVSWVHTNIKSIQHRKIGNRLRFTEADLEAFWEKYRVTPAGKTVEKPEVFEPGRLITTKRARELRSQG